mgnify:CR=1 FL=1
MPELGDEEEPVSEAAIPADPNVKNYSYTVVDGEVYFRENSIMVKPRLNATATARVIGMVELRDCVNRLIDLQMDDADALSIQAEQKKLNTLYDAFTARFGLISNRGNELAFSDDNSYYLLSSLEVLDEDAISSARRICSPSGPSSPTGLLPMWTPLPRPWPSLSQKRRG